MISLEEYVDCSGYDEETIQILEQIADQFFKLGYKYAKDLQRNKS